MPLRYDAGHRYDTGLVYGGAAPSPNTPAMPTQNLITLDISDADWTAIDAALTTLDQKLGAKLLDLDTDQRRGLNKMGDKSEAFARQALITSRQSAGSLPPDTVTALTAAEGDLINLDKVRIRLARLTALREKTDDTEVALGSDIMEFALFAYGVLKALGLGGGLDALRAQLGARFARRPRTGGTPPPTP